MLENKTCLDCKVGKSRDEFYNRPVSKQFCVNCNLMIGYAKDSNLILEKAIRYLEI